MRKLLTLLIFAFLFFGCASKDTEAENLSEIPEVSPVVEEDLPIDEDFLDETGIPKSEEELLGETDDYYLEDIQNIPEVDYENLSDLDIFYDTETEDLESLLIFPEDFEAPDYIEFLPVIIPEEKQEELLLEKNLDESLLNDIILDYDSEIDKNQENLEIIQNQLLDEVKSEDNLLDDDVDFSESPELSEQNIENPLEENEEVFENSDDSVDFENSEDFIDFDRVESFDDSLIQDDLSSFDTIDSNQEDGFLSSQDDFDLSQDDESLLSDTVDIPLEEIFTLDEDFIPLEPVETEVATPTRSMIMNNNQKLLVVFPGTGWIFLGDEYDSNTLIFDKRNIYDDSTEFVFRSSESGEALLHFYKQDLLTNEPINDYLLVTINPKKGKFETIEAPEYTFGTFVEEDAFMDEYYEEEYYDYGIIEDEPEVMFFTDEEYFFPDEAVSVEEIMDLAEAFYEDKMYIEALDQLDYYFTVTDGTADEYTDYALFMKGQILEQNSACKNIKESLNAYKELVNNYPDSAYWNNAQDRVVYLERFYFSVR